MEKTTKMQLLDLSDDILEMIFDHLPLADVLRTRRVNERFRRISEKKLTETRYLDLCELEMLRIRKTKWFEPILRACAANLERVRFIDAWDQCCMCNRSWIDTIVSKWLDAFDEFQYPNLVRVDLANTRTHDDSIDEFCGLRRLLEAPNLRVVTMSRWCFERFRFPRGNRIEEIRIDAMNMYFAPLLKQFGHLRRVTISSMSARPIATDWETFFKTCPSIESLSTCVNPFKNIRHPVETLRELTITSMADGHLCYKISRIAPNLRSLRMTYVDPRWIYKRNVARIAGMKHLESIYISMSPAWTQDGYRDFNRSVQMFVLARRLRTATFVGFRSLSVTVETLARECTDLSRLRVGKITAIDTPERFAAFLHRFKDVGRDVILEMDKSKAAYNAWRTPTVRSKLEELERNGTKLRIVFNDEFSKWE